jgi:hypothetical protein
MKRNKLSLILIIISLIISFCVVGKNDFNSIITISLIGFLEIISIFIMNIYVDLKIAKNNMKNDIENSEKKILK